MPIFAAVTEQTTAVSTSAVEVFNASNSVFATGAALGDVIVINQGPDDCFLGQSGVTATTGLRLPAGQSLNMGTSYTQGQSAANIYAICASSTSATVSTGLGSVDSNV